MADQSSIELPIAIWDRIFNELPFVLYMKVKDFLRRRFPKVCDKFAKRTSVCLNRAAFAYLYIFKYLESDERFSVRHVVFKQDNANETLIRLAITIFPNIYKLEILDTNFSKEECFLLMVKGFKLLTTLNLHNVKVLQYLDERSKSEALKYLEPCSQFLNTIWFYDTNLLPSSVINYLANSRLEFRDLSIFESELDNKEIATLLKQKGSNLKRLELNCISLSDRAICELRYCHELQSLTLSFCTKLTDISYKQIKKMKKLQYLHIEDCNLFFEADIRKHVLPQSSLVTLKLIEFPNLSTETLKFIANEYKSLQILDFSCTEIENEGLKQILEKCQALHKLTLDNINEHVITLLKHKLQAILDLHIVNLGAHSLDILCAFLKGAPSLRAVWLKVGRYCVVKLPRDGKLALVKNLSIED